MPDQTNQQDQEKRDQDKQDSKAAVQLQKTRYANGHSLSWVFALY